MASLTFKRSLYYRRINFDLAKAPIEFFSAFLSSSKQMQVFNLDYITTASFQILRNSSFFNRSAAHETHIEIIAAS
jgi:hypothetical protein